MSNPVGWEDGSHCLRLLPILLLVGNKGCLGKEVCRSKATGCLVELEQLQAVYGTCW